MDAATDVIFYRTEVTFSTCEFVESDLLTAD